MSCRDINVGALDDLQGVGGPRVGRLKGDDLLGVNYSAENALTFENKAPAGQRGSVQVH